VKPALEFFPTDDLDCSPVEGRPGVSERVLALDPGTGMLTRLLRWDPGFDSTAAGPVTHPHVEEVLILSGSMRDVGLDAVFGAGFYASRPPGMVHGPWVSEEGCVMLETRYLPAD
jgi:hypothetical protein